MLNVLGVTSDCRYISTQVRTLDDAKARLASWAVDHWIVRGGSVRLIRGFVGEASNPNGTPLEFVPAILAGGAVTLALVDRVNVVR